MAKHRLTDAEWLKLAEVNRLLTELTVEHSICCKCELCVSRAWTDVQDESSRYVEYNPWQDDLVRSANPTRLLVGFVHGDRRDDEP